MDVGVNAAGGFQYVLVMLEGVSGYAWLRPSRACPANGTLEELVHWCATFGPPTTWVRDNTTHFRNRVVRKLEITGCSASVLSGQQRVDQRDRRAHDARSDPRGESDAQRGGAAAPRVGFGTNDRAMIIEHGVAKAAADNSLPRHGEA